MKKTGRKVMVGTVPIGGDADISIQTMWKEPLKPAGFEQIIDGVFRLASLGCDIIRFAVPDETAADLLIRIAEKSPIPTVADIHFDHSLAMRVMDGPIAKVRINPGNIGAEWKVKEVVAKASDRGIPIRVGVNAGSLPPRLRSRTDRVEAMLTAGEDELEQLEKYGFGAIVMSFKSSSVEETVAVNRIFSAKYDYPLHLGVTEAGPLIPGLVKNTTALSLLIREGIGDTIRISLSETPDQEVIAGREILRAQGLGRRGINIVSCPQCSRSTFDVRGFLAGNSSFLYGFDCDLTVAVMGCAVNGPGEARHADLAITGVGNKVMIFRNGEILHRCEQEEAPGIFRKELENICG